MGVAPAANDAVSPEIIISGQFSGQLFRAFAPGDIGRSGNAPHRHEVFMLDRLLSDRDVEKITGRARSTLQKDRIVGTGIPFVRLGRRACGLLITPGTIISLSSLVFLIFARCLLRSSAMPISSVSRKSMSR
jgi:hypothetical protein